MSDEQRTALVDAAATEIVAEAAKAMGKFAPFNSSHEGYAVILEELDELWDEVKANNVPRSIEEAVQVGAMALRYIVDMRAAHYGDCAPQQIVESAERPEADPAAPDVIEQVARYLQERNRVGDGGWDAISERGRELYRQRAREIAAILAGSEVTT